MRGLTLGSYAELLYSMPAAGTALANTTTRTLLSASSITAPAFKLPAGFFPPGGAPGQAIEVVAAGTYSTTSTPTLTVALAVDTTQGTYGTTLAATGAYTTEPGASSYGWLLRALVTLTAAGTSGTLNVTGTFTHGPASNAATAAAAALMVGATGVAIDTLVDNYLELWGTWGTASASNTITCDQLLVYGLN